jgi:hypothetical protein
MEYKNIRKEKTKIGTVNEPWSRLSLSSRSPTPLSLRTEEAAFCKTLVNVYRK